MTLIPYLENQPTVSKKAYVLPGAIIAGDVRIDDHVSVWFNAVIRGDMARITIGENTNVQDLTVIHTNTASPTVIGRNVTIGHQAIIHACTIEDDALIGMGAVILDGAIIKKGAMVAAGTVVPPKKIVESYHLALGNPMVIKRPLTDLEIEHNRANIAHYIDLAQAYVKSEK
jgi:carbonic anhydrase/acetyltransferase-like protein (isoleucine patch superfamily)